MARKSKGEIDPGADMPAEPGALVVNDKTRDELARRAKEIIALEDQHAELKADAKEVKTQIGEAYTNAASAGFSPKVLRRVITEMRMEPDERQGVLDFEAEVDTYRRALGLDTLLDRHGEG